MPALYAGFGGVSATFPLTMNITPGEIPKYQILPYGSSTIIQRYNASGGVPPYTYVASYVSGDVLTTSGLTTSAPEFTAVGDGTMINTKTGTYNLEVTDSAANSLNEDITMEFIFGLNPP